MQAAGCSSRSRVATSSLGASTRTVRLLCDEARPEQAEQVASGKARRQPRPQDAACPDDGHPVGQDVLRAAQTMRERGKLGPRELDDVIGVGRDHEWLGGGSHDRSVREQLLRDGCERVGRDEVEAQNALARKRRVPADDVGANGHLSRSVCRRTRTTTERSERGDAMRPRSGRRRGGVAEDAASREIASAPLQLFLNHCMVRTSGEGESTGPHCGGLRVRGCG